MFKMKTTASGKLIKAEVINLAHYQTIHEGDKFENCFLSVNYDDALEFQANLSVQIISSCFVSLNFIYIPKNGEANKIMLNLVKTGDDNFHVILQAYSKTITKDINDSKDFLLKLNESIINCIGIASVTSISDDLIMEQAKKLLLTYSGIARVGMHGDKASRILQSQIIDSFKNEAVFFYNQIDWHTSNPGMKIS